MLRRKREVVSRRVTTSHFPCVTPRRNALCGTSVSVEFEKVVHRAVGRTRLHGPKKFKLDCGRAREGRVEDNAMLSVIRDHPKEKHVIIVSKYGGDTNKAYKKELGFALHTLFQSLGKGVMGYKWSPLVTVQESETK